MRLSERTAVTLLFFLNGVIFSSFFARLPAIKSDLGASDGELGVAGAARRGDGRAAS